MHYAGGRQYRLIPRFRWDESARVVGAEPYRFGAAGALLPVDLALAWGPLLRPPFAGRISYSQFSRFYLWRTKDGSLDRGTIVSHSANTHVIPATARLRTAIRCVVEGRRRAPRRAGSWTSRAWTIRASAGAPARPAMTRGPTPARRSTSSG